MALIDRAMKRNSENVAYRMSVSKSATSSIIMDSTDFFADKFGKRGIENLMEIQLTIKTIDVMGEKNLTFMIANMAGRLPSLAAA